MVTGIKVTLVKVSQAAQATALHADFLNGVFAKELQKALHEPHPMNLLN